MTTIAPACPLIEADRLRVVRDDFVVWNEISFRVEGRRVGLVGDFAALFQVLNRQAEITRGQLWVDGDPAEGALRRGSVAAVESRPQLPGHLACLEYLSESAHLAGQDFPRKRLLERLRELAFEWCAGRRLSSLSLVEARALLLVQGALVPASLRVVALETPLLGLSPAEQEWLCGVIGRLLTPEQKLVVTLAPRPRSPAERRLYAALDGIFQLASGKVSRAVDPRGSGVRHLVVVAERGEEFCEALAGVGVVAEPTFAGPQAAASAFDAPPVADPANHLFVFLDGQTGSQNLMELSAKLRIPLLELMPLDDDSP